jgi:hypothetical protein
MLKFADDKGNINGNVRGNDNGYWNADMTITITLFIPSKKNVGVIKEMTRMFTQKCSLKMAKF